MDQKNSENIYEKLNEYEQKIHYLQKQLEAIKNASEDIASLGENIEELKGKKGEEVFANLGRGIYIKAKLLSENFLVDIGDKKLIKKNIPETQKLIEKQIKRLDDAEKEINHTLEDIQKEMMKIISENFKDSENLSS